MKCDWCKTLIGSGDSSFETEAGEILCDICREEYLDLSALADDEDNYDERLQEDY